MKRQKQKNERGAASKLSLLNPLNLQKEVHMYGYNFSWKSHLFVMIFSLLGISAIGILYKLQPIYFAITLAIVVIILPVGIISTNVSAETFC